MTERTADTGHGGHTFGGSAHVTTRDGRRLHYQSRGTAPAGTPTVVFESGMGMSRSAWGLVQPAIADRTRAVVYDRAGFGGSDDDTEPRTLARIADDLDALLRALGDGPFVLVGHSWGGPIVRTLAARDTARFSGLVLVDPTDENADLYFAATTEKRFALTARLLPGLARIGLSRALGSRPGRVQPPDVAADHRRDDFSLRAAHSTVREMAPLAAELRAIRTAPLELGDLEVVVISGTKASRMERAVRASITEAHRRTVAALANARLVEAPGSAHLVMFTEPELITREIVRLLG